MRGGRMKNLLGLRFLTAMLRMFLIFGATDALAQKRKPVIKKKTTVKRTTVVKKPVVPLYTVKTGEVFRVRMNETLSSKTARVGNTFTTTVTEPVYSTTGVVVIPTGSKVKGRVDSVTKAKKGG